MQKKNSNIIVPRLHFDIARQLARAAQSKIKRFFVVLAARRLTGDENGEQFFWCVGRGLIHESVS